MGQRGRQLACSRLSAIVAGACGPDREHVTRGSDEAAGLSQTFCLPWHPLGGRRFPQRCFPRRSGGPLPPALATPPPALATPLPEAPAHRPAARASPLLGVAPAGRLQEGRTAQEGRSKRGREVWTESLSPLGPQRSLAVSARRGVLSAVSG